MQNKLLALLLLVMSIPLVITSFHSIRISSRALKNQATEDFLQYSRHSTEMIERLLLNVKEDLVLLKNDPHLNKLIEQDRQAEADDIYKRVSENFFFLSQVGKVYDQVRYIDESGQEIVRVNYDGTTHKIVPSDELQNKKHRYYFQQTMALQPGLVFVSPLDLNREQGKVKLPFKPMIRYAAPVYNKKGEKKGIIILNVFASHFLNDMQKKHSLKYKKTFLINKDGFYLKHYDASKEWGGPRDLNTGENIFKDYPEEITSQIISGQSGNLDYQDELISYDTIFFSEDKDRYWIFIDTNPKKEIFKPVTDFKKLFAIVIVVSSLIAIVIGVLISAHFTKPLRRLNYWAKKIAGGDFLYQVTIKTGDEI